jgi:hypothetical protein
MLLGKRIIAFGQDPTVEAAHQMRVPGIMKVMKSPGIDFPPIMNRHVDCAFDEKYEHYTHSRLALHRALRDERHRSHLDPDLVPSHFTTKPMHPLTRYRRTASIGEPEPPAVERTDDFAFLDPAVAQ